MSCWPHGIVSACVLAVLLWLPGLVGLSPSSCSPSSSLSASSSVSLGSVRWGPLNLSSYASQTAVDSSRAVQLSRVEQLHFDQQVLQAHAMRLSLVFFTLISERYEWRPLMRVMVGEVVEWGVAYSADLHFVVSTETGGAAPTEQKAQQLLDDCEDLIRQLLATAEPPLSAEQLSAVTVLSSLGNAYEYPGISRVWTLARLSPDPTRHVILYYHSKGMFNQDDTGKPFPSRSKKNWMLSQEVIRPWRSHLQRFADEPSMRKLGHATSVEGFMWMNFMYMRASYVQLLVRPRRMDNRYWHEWWASMVEPTTSPNCSRACRWAQMPVDASLDNVEAELFPCTSSDTPDPGNMGEWCWAGPGHTWSVAAGEHGWSGQLVAIEDWSVLQMHGEASLGTATPPPPRSKR